MLPCLCFACLSGRAPVSMFYLPNWPCFHVCFTYLIRRAFMSMFDLSYWPRFHAHASMSMIDLLYWPCSNVYVLPTLLTVLSCLCLAYLTGRASMPTFYLPYSPCFYELAILRSLCFPVLLAMLPFLYMAYLKWTLSFFNLDTSCKPVILPSLLNCPCMCF